MLLVTLAGVATATLGFIAVRQVQKRWKDLTIFALIFYVALTPPLGYFIAGEPTGTQFQLGWMLGAAICTLLGLISLARQGRL